MSMRSSLAGIQSPAEALPPSQSSKQQRVLACTLCRQRKVKCDHKFPCSNCIKSRVKCVPTTVLPRRRPRRRFPGKDVLEHLHKYEELLRQNNVGFEPLYTESATGKKMTNADGGHNARKDQQPEAAKTESPSLSTIGESEIVLQYEAKNFWHAMDKRIQNNPDSQSNASNDDAREVNIKRAWDQLSGNDIFLVFGSRKTAASLISLHPDPVQIFRLWQVYLDNVNPLVKVVHAPSLQVSIIKAMSNLENISPTLEALMFSIYCMSLVSLTVEDCHAMFGLPKEDILTRYQCGCQQALLNCGFLRNNDRDCLTAFYLYIISVGSSTDPHTLSSMLGVAFRIAQRLGIHNESIPAKCTTPFEAEMRRRLWWSLVLFDTRISELAGHKSVSLDPTWNCKMPLNVNDSDLQPDMKHMPEARSYSTDAIYAIVRAELGEFLRRSDFHLDFTNPALKPIARDVQNRDTGDLDTLEKKIEEKYLKFCDPEIPLHFMTIWMTRGHLARCRLVEQYWKFGSSTTSTTHITDEQLDNTTSHAFRMLECDTKLMTSPLTKGYLWLAQFHFQFLAYIHIAQDLRSRPASKHAEQAWKLMNENFEARFATISTHRIPLFKLFAATVLPAWEASKGLGDSSTPPRIVSSIKQKLAKLKQISHNGEVVKETTQLNNITDPNSQDSSIPMPMGLCANSQMLDMGIGTQDGYAGTGDMFFSGLFGPATLGVDMNQVDWAAMDWGFDGWCS
ncbi:hypothetical protein AAE478_001050 [Parahypoxylon ruwenzoriense]